MARLFFTAFFAILVATPVLAQLDQERTWTGKNGKTFRGKFLRVDKSGKYAFYSVTHRTELLIEKTKISDNDLKWIAAEQKKVVPPAPKEAVQGTFKPDPNPPAARDPLPLLDSDEFKHNTFETAFCNFLLWWDQTGYLPVDQRGDFARKAKWVERKVGSAFKKSTSKPLPFREAMGVDAYFEEHLKSLATYRVDQVYDCSPANLARYTKGPNITIIKATPFHGNRDFSSSYLPVSSVSPDGTIILNIFGNRVVGKMKLLKEKVRINRTHFRQIDYSRLKETANSYEIILDPNTAPDWMIEREERYEIQPDKGSCLSIIRPYRYAVEGAVSPPPPGPLVPEPGVDPALASGVLPASKFPYAFNPPTPLDRDWTLSDGTRIRGACANATADEITLLVKGKKVTHPVAKLKSVDRLLATMWRGLVGRPISVSAGVIEYEIVTPKVRFPCTIRFHEPRFRIEMPSLQTTIIGDLKSGGFLVRRGKENHIGRLDPALLTLKPPSKPPLDLWLDHLNAIPAAAMAKGSGWPARQLRWAGDGPQASFQQPQLQFTALDCPSALAALSLILEADKHPLFLYLNVPSVISGCHGSREYLGFCRHTRLLPTKLEWKAHNRDLSLELKAFTLSPPKGSYLSVPPAAERTKANSLQKYSAR